MKSAIIASLLVLTSLFSLEARTENHRKTEKERAYWVETMDKICRPVLENLSEGTLRINMPVETNNKNPESMREVAHLEAFGRIMSGLAPWLELGPDQTKEGQLRAKYILMTLQALKNSVDPDSQDCLNFSQGRQPLVDAAFLSQGLLRSRAQIWNQLDTCTQNRLVLALKSTRAIKPLESNWLLFTAMVECALKEFTGEWDFDKVEYALTKHAEWYKGDGWYGDGPNMHFDYYNSYVIQPMLMQVLEIVAKYDPQRASEVTIHQKRYARYAEQLERLISPDGSYPAVGRSLAYRFGAFSALSDVSYRQLLPSSVSPAQVRSALTAVIKKQMSMDDTFDRKGWLTIGFAGHQPSIGERYINTGSLYLCSHVFVALGLPAESDFWSLPSEDWTQKKVWNGLDFTCDKALKEKKK